MRRHGAAPSDEPEKVTFSLSQIEDITDSLLAEFKKMEASTDTPKDKGVVAATVVLPGQTTISRELRDLRAAFDLLRENDADLTTKSEKPLPVNPHFSAAVFSSTDIRQVRSWIRTVHDEFVKPIVAATIAAKLDRVSEESARAEARRERERQAAEEEKAKVAVTAGAGPLRVAVHQAPEEIKESKSSQDLMRLAKLMPDAYAVEEKSRPATKIPVIGSVIKKAKKSHAKSISNMVTELEEMKPAAGKTKFQAQVDHLYGFYLRKEAAHELKYKAYRHKRTNLLSSKVERDLPTKLEKNPHDHHHTRFVAVLLKDMVTRHGDELDDALRQEILAKVKDIAAPASFDPARTLGTARPATPV